MLKKTFVLVLILTIIHLAESSPVNVDTLDFDNLDVDYTDIGYERDEPLWGSTFFLKLLEEVTRKPPKDAKASKDSAETSAKMSGSKKKNNLTKGVHSTHNRGDLNSFFKKADDYDHGEYDDSKEFAKAAATAALAAVAKGKETRTYARGNKTTGFHRVHHKDEYKKDQEFYENDETKGTINKAGAKAVGTTASAGSGFKVGSFKHDRHRGIHGKQGYLDNGFSDKQFNEYMNSADGEFSSELDK